ncbi:MAG: 2-C-methyl-D-erythritol 2,4-cyclodiphosphate synthase [Deltaproteobacteria bacterium]|nr:2-C-methyl-D-erythritol 2,4-cyclodiphosphate synthase [Deltaproteobacteria bacterium]
MRIGTGYDIHRLTSGRKLILGGVTIPFEKGLAGHSDADVLVHAVIDAVLGACAQKDIGEQFPDSSSEYKDIFSIKLLEKTYNIIKEKNFKIVNIDATILAEKPKLSPYKQKMEINIAKALRIEASAVNVKATTTERLGVIGKGDGIAAMCAALVENIA